MQQNKVKYSTLKNEFVKIRLGVSARIINKLPITRAQVHTTPYYPPFKGGKVLIYNVNTFYILFILFISV